MIGLFLQKLQNYNESLDILNLNFVPCRTSHIYCSRGSHCGWIRFTFVTKLVDKYKRKKLG